ncbi:hypothetical protein EDC01DRAFT_651448 [Geopyxis carbonaria]|nr:hypothetical protein EDC01DRAFT_651448 [Geopyxis carbonaria]
MKNDIKYQTIIVHIDCPDLVGLAEKVLDRMENHWKQRLCRRWERLNLEPLWIFCDLFVVFEWNNTFKTLSTELGKMNKGILNQSSIIDQTQSLHKLVGITISVSENLRIQTLVAESLKKWLKKATKNPESTIACHNRIYNISQKLASHRHTADVLRQQFQNMIDLKFNMVAISQGAVVGRLSLLGFIFIPVSFVATIFGMTEFHGSPVYFPVAAFLTLIVIGGFAWPLLAPLIKTKWIGKHYEETKTRQLVIVTHRSTSMDSQTEYTDGNHFSTGAVH